MADTTLVEPAAAVPASPAPAPRRDPKRPSWSDYQEMLDETEPAPPRDACSKSVEGCVSMGNEKNQRQPQAESNAVVVSPTMLALSSGVSSVREQKAPAVVARPSDPNPNLFSRLGHRLPILLGLLIFQSGSSFILASYEELISTHAVIVAFLTMLVGSGGNAGNQAAVLVIRQIATGELTSGAQLRYLWNELKLALLITAVLVAAGFGRVAVFGYSMHDAIAIAASLGVIVSTSILVGAALPMMLHRLGLDPVHAGSTIQVIMDLVGVLVTCCVCDLVLVEGEP